MTNFILEKTGLIALAIALVLLTLLPATAFAYDYSYNYYRSSVEQTPTISASDYFARERAKWASDGVTVTPMISSSEAFDRDDPRGSVLGADTDSVDLNAGNLEILDISVVNADIDPKSKKDVFSNCNIEIHWQTNDATVGQVIYGTQSQAEVDIMDVRYPNSEITGSSFRRVHAVRLDCLTNETYYFRVVAFSGDEMNMSAERILVPFGGAVAVADVSGGVDVSGGMSAVVDAGGASASVLGTIGRVSIPVFFLIFLLVIGYLIIKWVRGQSGGNGNGNGGFDSAELDEPVINIASGQSPQSQ